MVKNIKFRQNIGHIMKKKYDFSNLGNANEFESAATSVADLTRQMVRVVQSGDVELAEHFVQSPGYRAFQQQLIALPDYIVTSYIYNCVAAYISAIGVMASFSAAEQLLDKTTHERYVMPEEYLEAMSNAVMAFAAIVREDKRRQETGGYVSRAGAYIKDHLYAAVDLESVADYCGCSLSHLRHSFKKEKGISLVRYIQQEKIEKAKQMLHSTDYSAARISSQLGFCSESYFIQVFRKHTGVTPRRYRMTPEAEADKK